MSNKLSKKDRQSIVEHYYMAQSALVTISVLENIPEDLKEIIINAGSSVHKIIDYINLEVENDKD